MSRIQLGHRVQRYNPGLLYRFADDFMKLSPFSRFSVGLDMKLLDDADAYQDQDKIDLQVYRGAILGNRLPEFARLIYKAAGHGKEII